MKQKRTQYRNLSKRLNTSTPVRFVALLTVIFFSALTFYVARDVFGDRIILIGALLFLITVGFRALWQLASEGSEDA